MTTIDYNAPAFTKRIRWTRTCRPHYGTVYEREGSLLGHAVAFRVSTNPTGPLGRSDSTHVRVWVDGVETHVHTLGGLTKNAETAVEIIRERVALLEREAA